MNSAICAVKVYKKNVETIFATFDLTNARENQTFYIFVNSKTSIETIETIKGIAGFSELKVDVSRSVYRPNESAYADITVINKGDTDVFIPTIYLSTMQYIPRNSTIYHVLQNGKAVFEDLSLQGDALSIAQNSSLKLIGNKNSKTKDQKRYAIFEDQSLQDILWIEQKPSFKFIKINNYDYPPYSSDYIVPLNLNGIGAIIQPRSKVSLRLKAQPYTANFEGSGRFSIIEDNFLSYVKRNLNTYRPESYSDFVWNSISKSATL